MRKIIFILFSILFVGSVQAQKILPPTGFSITDIDDDPEIIGKLINNQLVQKQSNSSKQEDDLKRAIDALQREKAALEASEAKRQKALEDALKKNKALEDAKKNQTQDQLKKDKALKEAMRKNEELKDNQEKSMKRRLTPSEEMLLKRTIAFINVVSRDLSIENPCALVSYASLANTFRIPLPYFKLYLSAVANIDQKFFNLIKIPKETSLERKGIAILSAINLQNDTSRALILASQLFGSPLVNQMRLLWTAGVNRGGITYINKLRIAEEKSHVSYKIATDYCNMKLSTQSFT